MLDILNQFDFLAAVPAGGSASYSEIAAVTKVPEAIVRRILRHAFTVHLFAEAPLPQKDRVVHTATTAFLSKSQAVRGFVSHNLEEMRQATTYTPEALRRFSIGREQPSQELEESGFAVADVKHSGRRTTFFDYLSADEAKAKSFAQGMQAVAVASVTGNAETITSRYDWASLGTATVVDVGGSAGHDAAVLAANFPNLHLVVQDLPNIEPAFRATVPTELQKSGRVRFESHDFLMPQSLAADVYMLKWVLHDWPDKYAIRILRHLLPHLEAGAADGHSKRRILLHEVVLPPIRDDSGKPSLPPYVERLSVTLDLHMLVAFNSQERTLEHWTALAKQADDRLETRLVATFPGTLWGLLELSFKS